MDGEKGEFQALALDQKAEFQALRATLSLDLSNCKLRQPQPTTTAAGNEPPRADPTAEQKQYAQGFFDALRTVQQIHNFEFEKKVLSPGFIAPIVGSELLTPLISPSSRDYQAILNAMVAKTPIMQPMVGMTAAAANSSLATGFPTAISAPGSSSSSAAAVATTGAAPAPSTSATVSAPEPPPITARVEIKQEPRCVSEDSTESDRSRSSSTTTTAHHHSRQPRSDLELVMDEQEKRKLDRKRARNRAAATKCRQKKIDRIQELETMVTQEKQRAQGLDMEMESMRNTLQQLQQLIQMHEQRGCARS